MSRNACNGENGKSGKKLPASGDLNWMPKEAPWRLAILAKLVVLAKIARGLAIMAINVPTPRRLAILAKIAKGFGDIQNVANIQIGCQKWPLQIR